jgi:hypothetical protein
VPLFAWSFVVVFLLKLTASVALSANFFPIMSSLLLFSRISSEPIGDGLNDLTWFAL